MMSGCFQTTKSVADFTTSVGRAPHLRRGVTLIYASVSIVAMFGMLSLAVDYGRAQLVKTELQRLADAAAVYSAAQVTNLTNLRSFARASALENTVDGAALTLTDADIEQGTWNAATRTFTPTGSFPTAVRITARRVASRGTAVPLIFGRIIGRNDVDVSASSVTMWVAPVTTNTTVDARRSIYYYGLANGTNIPDPWGGDTVNASMRPIEITVAPGDRISLSASGSATYSASGGTYSGPNGGLGTTSQAQLGYLNGFSDLIAPSVSLSGAFVGAGSPPTPSTLDFTLQSSRDVLDISPRLKQVFFAGDGNQSSSAKRDYIVPAGATTLLLGVYDSWIWRDNAGSFTVSITTKGRARLLR